MRASHYAHALKNMLPDYLGKEDMLLENFAGTVERNGHRHLFPKIVRSFGRILEKEEQSRTIEVTSSKDLSPEDVSALLKKEPFSHALSSDHRKVVRKIDEGIVGGVIVRTGSIRVDASYKRALLDLYQNMTKTL